MPVETVLWGFLSPRLSKHKAVLEVVPHVTERY